MKNTTAKSSLKNGTAENGLVFFDEYLNDEDFLEFLIEWSDSIVQKENCSSSAGNASGASRDGSMKRKIDQLSCTSKPLTAKQTLANIDAALVKLPVNIFEAFNTGDLNHLKEIIDVGMTKDCLFKTMMIDKALVGSNFYFEFWTKLAVSHPDMVFVLKKVRVTNVEGEAKFIKFNFFFTGTNAFPGATETYYYNNDDYLAKNLDCSRYSEAEKTAMNSLIAQHRAFGTPYVGFGRGTGLYQVNDKNMVDSLFFEWKLTSICPAAGEGPSL